MNFAQQPHHFRLGYAAELRGWGFDRNYYGKIADGRDRADYLAGANLGRKARGASLSPIRQEDVQ